MSYRTKLMLCALLLMVAGTSAPAQQTVKAEAKKESVPAAFQELQSVEDRWDDAVTKRDQYALELVLAPEFIGISASGDVTTRKQQIAQLFVKDALPESLQQKVINVRFVDAVAVVNGTYTLTWKGEKGPVLEKGIFSHVFQHVPSGWQCLNSQRTVVADEMTGPAVKEKAKPAKRSDAELPMHVPLVYKGPQSTQTAPPPAAANPPSQ
jgi:hypothetical protein